MALYEAAVLRFVETILNRACPFIQAFLPFQARIAELGIYNSLAQLLITIAAPGIPDVYQRTELWDLSLVDPDNRRPVDSALRRRWLEEIRAEQGKPEDAPATALLDRRRDGRVTLFVMVRALQARARMRPALHDVFRGNDIPVQHAESGASIEAAAIVERFPVALLVPVSPQPPRPSVASPCTT